MLLIAALLLMAVNLVVQQRRARSLRLAVSGTRFE
jgi:hypothetical protein